MTLNELLAALPQYQTLSPIHEVEIQQITTDSRQVQPGTLFVAYQGVSVDSHHFIPQAIANGASVIVAEHLNAPHPQPLSQGERGESLLPLPLGEGWGEGDSTTIYLTVPDGREALAHLAAAWHGYPARQLAMIGITGTDGKTTTTNLLYQILRAAGKRVSMISTVNAVIGDEVLETGLHTTTPDAPDIQRYLAAMVAAGTEICLLETTSHGLAHHRVTACEFDMAIVTNITHEHLDAHGNSLENYRAAKAKLFESLATAQAKGYPKCAILNADDGSFHYLKAKLEANKTPWYAYSHQQHPAATVTATEIHYDATGSRFTVHVQARVEHARSFEVVSPLIGRYNVSNCLAAATAALTWFNLPSTAIQQGIANIGQIPGRMERIDEGQPFVALVDFAHTPNALANALQVARTLTTGRVIAVFGCAGLRDVDKRAMMGQVAAQWADYTIITAEDPRTENLADIMAATAEVMQAHGAIEGQTFERVADRGQAIYRATQLAQPNDVVMALGKGHEQSMCFGTTEYPWDDRQAMRHALRGQPLLTLPTANLPVVIGH